MERLNQQLKREILNFGRYIAGSSKLEAGCICGDYAFGTFKKGAMIEVLLVIQSFQPRLMSYIKNFEGKTVLVFAVDKWVFERDVEGGFLGEALAGKIVFPYIPLLNEKYLYFQEVKIKKRLILELLKNLILEFPELSYNLYIKPQFFMYETILDMTRIFPILIYSVLNLLEKNVKEKNQKIIMRGFLKALKELENEKTVSFSGEYVQISGSFIKNTKRERKMFLKIFRDTRKTIQKALFTFLLNIFPKVLDLSLQSRETFINFHKLSRRKNASNFIFQLEDPQNYLYVPTVKGLVPLSNRVNIEKFVREFLSTHRKVTVKVKKMGGVLNDVYLVKASANNFEKLFVVKKFKEWSSLKWFPLTLWALGTKTFTLSGTSRLERECAINNFLTLKGLTVPRILHISRKEKLVFMEYVRGENLVNVIKGLFKKKDIESELALINLVGKTIGRVHSFDVVLGDTKPENFIVKDGEVYLLDFEQASRKGDKVWDVAEFLYYSGHYFPFLTKVKLIEAFTESFLDGYVAGGGDVKVVVKVGNPKYTKVFSIFTLPHIILTIANVCKKFEKRINHG